LENFESYWYHTGLWALEGVNFTNLRVPVIGIGSSSVQLIRVCHI
jgi:cyclohexanone monooxygenase